ncbi:alpha/beta hydrolase [uncultured Methanobrevibacter sp.]|uniref:alpha/beta hydrolase n=1 Tax=uncultured Methanobrevibacter sp. TaxID=253161 RepID=UPI00262CDDE9
MNKKLKIVLYIILALIIIVGAFGIYYINDFYHADESVDAYLNGSDNVSVIEIDDGLFLDGPGNETALIFYPGAKIESTAYLPMLSELSSCGVDCFLMEMPFNLAFLGQNEADDVLDNSTYSYSNWYISGHSLGGAMAASYAANHDGLKGLILFASYPTEDLDDLSVLSIYGSNDKVLNRQSYESSKNLSDNFTERIIDGGNHAQFASYGNQSGDGLAQISSESQVNQSVNYVLDFIGEF